MFVIQRGKPRLYAGVIILLLYQLPYCLWSVGYFSKVANLAALCFCHGYPAVSLCTSSPTYLLNSFMTYPRNFGSEPLVSRNLILIASLEVQQFNT